MIDNSIENLGAFFSYLTMYKIVLSLYNHK